MPYHTNIRCLVKIRPNGYEFESVKVPNIIMIEHLLRLQSLTEWRRQIIMMDIEMASTDTSASILSYDTVMPFLRKQMDKIPFTIKEAEEMDAARFIDEVASYLKRTKRPSIQGRASG